MVEQRSGRTKVSNQGIYIRLFFSGHPTAFNFAYLWYRAMDTARNGSTADEDRIEEARLCPALRFSKHANFLPQGIRAYSDSVGSGPKVADIRSSDQLELAKNVPMAREGDSLSANPGPVARSGTTGQPPRFLSFGERVKYLDSCLQDLRSPFVPTFHSAA